VLQFHFRRRRCGLLSSRRGRCSDRELIESCNYRRTESPSLCAVSLGDGGVGPYASFRAELRPSTIKPLAFSSAL
jgi:hypothetical protein